MAQRATDFREKILKEGPMKHRQTSLSLPRVSRTCVCVCVREIQSMISSQLMAVCHGAEVAAGAIHLRLAG